MSGRDSVPKPRSFVSSMLARIRAMSAWSVLVAAVVFGFVFGLQLWVVVVAVFGFVWAGISRALSDRVAERFERQPELALQVAVGGGQWASSPPPARQPWPVDPDAIVQAEASRLAEEGDTFENMAKGPGGHLLRAPLSIPPSAGAYERARREFDSKVAEYADVLRQWLAEYRQRADERARTFELDLRVTAGPRGAYAENVSLELAIPPGVEIVDSRPTMSPPPDAPAYESPRTQPLFGAPEMASPASIASLARVRPFDFASITPRKLSAWTIDETDHRAKTSLGSVHHGSSERVRDALHVRVPSAGRFEIGWTLLAKNSRRHTTGALVLVVPEPVPRPPFKRLHGITTFPDVTLVNGDGEVVQAARTEDPPTSPPDTTEGPDATGEDALFARLREGRRLVEWQRLGLGEEENET